MADAVLPGLFPQTPSLREMVTALLPQGYARMVQPIASTTAR